MLTLNERERIAYIEGRTVEAALLAQAIDAESDAIDEMRHERDMAKEEASNYYQQNEELETAAEVAETKLADAQDEIKALQSEIREKCLDLL